MKYLQTCATTVVLPIKYDENKCGFNIYECCILPFQGATHDRRHLTQGDAIGLGYVRLSAWPNTVRLCRRGIFSYKKCSYTLLYMRAKNHYRAGLKPRPYDVGGAVGDWCKNIPGMHDIVGARGKTRPNRIKS
jgi:hypothetical protein